MGNVLSGSVIPEHAAWKSKEASGALRGELGTEDLSSYSSQLALTDNKQNHTPETTASCLAAHQICTMSADITLHLPEYDIRAKRFDHRKELHQKLAAVISYNNNKLPDVGYITRIRNGNYS